MAYILLYGPQRLEKLSEDDPQDADPMITDPPDKVSSDTPPESGDR